VRITPDVITEHERPYLTHHYADLDHTGALLARWSIDPEAVIAELQRFTVAAPSWAVGTGGTRFGRFPGGGEPRTTGEKVDDVAALNALTGANRSISLHVPWDDPPDPVGLREYAWSLGITFDAMNSNTFQDNASTTGNGEVSYKFGSMANADHAVRRHAVEHNLRVIEMGEHLGSSAITVWLADGTNHPGQADFRTQFERVAECLREVHDAMPGGWTLYTEHKPYEPAFYSTVNADWGSSLLLAQAAGDRARCLVDLGHHLPNTNIEQVVSRLGMVGRLGGFHFNDSAYGDDDLTTGSIRPYRFFLILVELLKLGARQAAGLHRMPSLAYMIDASHNVKDPLEDLIQATDQIQVSLAQALLVDWRELEEAQDANDPAAAAEVLQRAFRTDVRPLVAEARRRKGAAMRPLPTYRRCGYRNAVIDKRGVGAVASGL
jgi:L-rhamnose isomerase / sugar isomerase